MQKAFVLGAGLGERLRPLTDQLPKPLIPVFHKPLITYAFDHLLAEGVRSFVVNTHHLPEAYARTFPEGKYGESPVAFRHEAPVRLETAGGIANVRDLLGEEPFIVYNGDILTTLPLEPLIREHRERGNLVTLALRSSGPALHIGYDAETHRVIDIRNKLGTGNDGTHLFTGIYICEPEFHEWLTPGKVESVIPIFLTLIQQGKLGAIVLDEGDWWDLGSRAAYLEAHQALAQSGRNPAPAIHPTAQVSSEAQLSGLNIIGPDAVVEAGALLEDCVLWPGARVTGSSRLKRCIVRSGITATEIREGADL
ncbi:nucleotidyltransferase family protein [Brevifollis gellanilyticus]|uniref:Mannose-1-phosphate guanylyltransferase n=1 Tax=Brevifollis gellanilyticus TaxID=748831 RepID=A0A512MHF9_9BACT|nr:nucleotidyltransferase family protein [Brevifollis gellanilyticus]GEP46166.1 mannose-1-phosphate guanylyltransferase [Brevifollis gellanilyticus]